MDKELIEIDKLLKNLFPINRSISGNGNRVTLEKISQIIPLQIKEIPTGQEVYDWTIPKEWNVNDAWIKNKQGEKIIDFKKSNIHLVSYSTPVNKVISKKDLINHLHYEEGMPNAIPYRTTYYREDWGFCLSYNDFIQKIKNSSDEEFEVFIDSTLSEGSMSYGELVVEGKTSEEILISSYICHPSMANDSLSGVVVGAFLAKHLQSQKENLFHTYRIIFVPETIGAIAYSSINEQKMKKIKRAFVLTTCGGPGQFGYKKSWDSHNYINEAIESIFKNREISFITYPFDINGSDERQYSSLGFRINCITITKDKYYEYPEYHTSLDNLDFVKGTALYETLELYKDLLKELDGDIVFKNKRPNGEIRLGKYKDLASSIGGAYRPDVKLSDREIVMWLLFYCDGKTELSKISKKIDVELKELLKIVNILIQEDILEAVVD